MMVQMACKKTHTYIFLYDLYVYVHEHALYNETSEDTLSLSLLNDSIIL